MFRLENVLEEFFLVGGVAAVRGGDQERSGEEALFAGFGGDEIARLGCVHGVDMKLTRRRGHSTVRKPSRSE